ncbi:DUF2878 domain-containing protein [Reinekea thalattae]|uniref:DUF2878 domain-containing protein n=1 Tax=Reinekea thalattae TaxID=2593301 RepID=A0A5C8ZDK9_9GAMM|nr:DUF2878 domain-containing protein [Reinekea thalattae]TXR54880.1 DUF2878 domain-containing protein [Reinekea thalattae]
MILFNALLFNGLWFGLILQGNAFIPFALLGLALHIFLVNYRLFEIKTLLIVALIGLFTDAMLTVVGVFQFDHTPYWLILLWLAFASTINHSLGWIGKWKYTPYLCGFGAPFSYFAAHRFGAVGFGFSASVTYAILTAVWIGLFLVFTFVTTSTRFTYVSRHHPVH